MYRIIANRKNLHVCVTVKHVADRGMKNAAEVRRGNEGGVVFGIREDRLNVCIHLC